jgi:hypothetical protein
MTRRELGRVLAAAAAAGFVTARSSSSRHRACRPSSGVYTRLLVLLAVVLSCSGCIAAVALPALGLAAMSDAAGSVAKTGVEYTMGGATYRTFSAPVAEVHTAVLQSFRDLEIDVTEDELLDDGRFRVAAEARDRNITIKLEPVTPALTRLRMFVRKGWLGRDAATSTELVEQTARALTEIRPIAGPAPRARPIAGASPRAP